MPLADTAADAAQDPVTALLQAWTLGDPEAFGRLVSRVYADLKRIAHHALRKDSPKVLLQTTGLVHEAFIRMRNCQVDWQSNEQFYATFARLLRQILVDFGRRQRALKRSARPDSPASGRPFRDLRFRAPADVLDLNDALDELEEIDPSKARLVELRYFAGLSVAEVAAALGVSPATVKREWQATRLWLMRRLAGGKNA